MAVRSLLVKFIADVRQFVSGTKQAEKALTPFEAKMKSIRDISKTLTMVRGGAAFAGITAGAMALDRVLGKINEGILDMARGLKTSGEVLNDVVRSIPVTGSLGENIRMLALPQGRKEVAELVGAENMLANAELITKDLEVRIAATRKLKEEEEKLRKAGRERIQEMINLGRQQADDRTRELFETQAANRKKIDDMIRMGREQADERARSAFEFADEMLRIGREKSAKRMEDLIESRNAAAKVVAPTADFREISLSRTAIGGLSAQNRQQVMDPQLKETNRLLQLIESRFRTNGATYAP